MRHRTPASARIRDGGLGIDARTGGQPLDRATRDLLEAAFRTDLAAVRVHTGAGADRLASGLQADAFAAGNHVFFRDGAYRPDTSSGLRLLSHEVAHTVQQAAGRATPGQSAAARRCLEAEADRAAEHVLAGSPGTVAGTGVDAVRPRTPGEPLVLQRHDSFEHRALGDVPTADVYAVASNASDRDYILGREAKLMFLWHQDPQAVTPEQIAGLCPWIRTVRLQESDLLVTYGELNALPDYVANAAALDTIPADVLLPLLQTIRQECYNTYNKLAGNPTSVQFAYAPFKPNKWPIGLLNKLVETFALDHVTRSLGVKGTDHYQGLLGRNACHFAPFAWHRWQSSYLMARNYATLAHQASDSDRTARYTYLAWLYHGYADHFLQDSFAAGHLVNKNLIMQWWIEWNVSEGTVVPITDWDFIKGMTPQLQPDLAGRHLYDQGYQGPSNDPQTVEEQLTYGQRVALSGVVPHDEAAATAYQRYLGFLSSVITQATSASLHDYYNANSLWVASQHHPSAYEIWGDDTLFTGTNAGTGAQITSEAAQASQRSIRDLLASGKTDVTTEALRQRLPTKVRDDSGNLQDLETWQDGRKDWVVKKIFGNWKFLVERVGTRVSPLLVNLSRDQDFTNRWNTGVAAKGYPPVATLLVGERLFAVAGGTVMELDPATGDKVRSLQLSKAAATAPSMATDGDRLYVGYAGSVYGVDLAGWEVDWTYVLDKTDPQVAVVSLGSSVYACGNGTLVQLAAATGKKVDGGALASTSGQDTDMKTDGSTIYIGYHGYVYAVDPDRPYEPIWAKGVAGMTSTAVTVLPSGGKLYAGSNGYAMQYDPATGAQLHKLLVSSAVGVGDYQVKLATDGTRLYAGCHGYVYAIALNSWSKAAWTASMPGYLYSATVPLYGPDDGVLYAASNGYVASFDPATGTTLRSVELGSNLGTGDYTPSLCFSSADGLFVGMHGYAYNMTVFAQPDPGKDLLGYASADGSRYFWATKGDGQVTGFGGDQTWSKNWTAIVPGHYQGAKGFSDVALYSRSEDLLRLYGCSAGGQLTELGNHAQDHKWAAIVPGAFGGDSGYSDLCLYSSDDGLGRFSVTDGAGGLTQIGSDHNWQTIYSHVVAGTFGGGTAYSDLLFYSASEGTAKFFQVLGGTIHQIGGTHTWKMGWSHVIVADFGGGTGYSDLCLYHDKTGHAEFWRLTAPGTLEALGDRHQWKTGWTHVLPGRFGGGTARDDLAFYNASTQETKFFSVDAGKITEIGSPTKLPAGLTVLVAGQFQGGQHG